MASLLYNSCSRNYNNFSMECRPKMLKDFLIMDDSNSCSSSGFKWFPRKPCDSSVKAFIEIDLNNKIIASPSNNASNSYKQLGSRSKAAASTTISALQAMINAVKNIQFTAVKYPSILPRSLLRRSRSKKHSQNKENHEVKFTVTVKDIIRWRSFRDVAEEKSPPFDSASSPQHCATTTTGSTSTTPCSSISMGSSWCDSDFTSEYLPSWNGNLEGCDENVEEAGKKFLPRVGEYCRGAASSTETTACTSTVGPKEEEQQHSPVSVIEFKFEEDEEYSSSSFHQSLATVECTKQKIMDNIRRFESLAKLDPVNIEKRMSMDENISSEEDDDHYSDNVDGKVNISCEGEEEEEINEVEEKAWKLLNHVEETSSEYCYNVDYLLLDFFRAELATMGYDELLDRAKAWMNGEGSFLVGWEVEHKKEASVREMDREGRWSKFEKEREELGLDIENELLGALVDEILLDLISSPVSLQVQ